MSASVGPEWERFWRESSGVDSESPWDMSEDAYRAASESVRCGLCTARIESQGRPMREHVAREHPEHYPSYIDTETGEVRR